jgi:phosphate:Na+ symporter
LLFNVTGAILFTILLLIWSEGVVGTNFYDVTFASWFKDAPTTQIAMFHTFFNVLCTLLFLPFAELLVKLSKLIIPEKTQAEKEAWELVYMDKRFLTTPTVALGQLKKEAFRMADMSLQSLEWAFGGFIQRDLEVIEKVAEQNENISKISGQISDYLVQVSASGVSFNDEKLVSALHSNIGDIARIAELADNVTKYTKKEVKENLVFSAGINEKLEIMHGLLQKQYQLVKSITLDNDKSLLPESDSLEDEIDEMRRALVAEHITRLSQGKCRPENNTIFINLVCNLERIGDHLNFIAHSTDEA